MRITHPPTTANAIQTHSRVCRKLYMLRMLVQRGSLGMYGFGFFHLSATAAGPCRLLCQGCSCKPSCSIQHSEPFLLVMFGLSAAASAALRPADTTLGPMCGESRISCMRSQCHQCSNVQELRLCSSILVIGTRDHQLQSNHTERGSLLCNLQHVCLCLA